MSVPTLRFIAHSTLALVATVSFASAAAAQPAPPAPTPGPTMTEALNALEAARAAAAGLKVNLSCAVVDSRGDLVALTRMDGARFFTTDVARGKAQVSALFGQPSGGLAQFAASPFFSNLNTAAQGRLYPIQGALPIMRGGQLIGGIGCSGATSQQDEDAARAGLGVF
ncbi:MAG: heme-binding protein [Vicinamibacterales bacterium]